MRVAPALLAFLLLLAPARAEEDPGAAARAAAAALSAAARALQAAPDAPNRLAAYGAAVQAHEAGLAALRSGLRALAGRRAGLLLDLGAKRAEHARLIGLLLAIGRTPLPARAVHPSGPLGAARAAILMADLAPGVEAELIGLQAALSELDALARAEAEAEAALRAGLLGIRAARTGLAEALARRSLPEAGTEPAPASLAAGAATLAALAERLSRLPADGPAPDFAAAAGRLPLPVAGRVLRRFGEADAQGLARPGIVIEAAPHALVTAPFRATLRYAGPFLDFGGLAILEPGPGWLVVLGGLGRIDRQVGEVIGEGEAIGVLGGLQPDAEEFLIEGTKGDRPTRSETLYVEIRRDGEALDPGQWFAPGAAKEGNR